MDLDSGTGRRAAPAVSYAASALLRSAFGQFLWLTGDDYRDLLAKLKKDGGEGLGQPGQGGSLGLTPVASAKDGKQTDPNLDNNWQNLDIKVLGQQGTDFVAVGATAKGAKGDTATSATARGWSRPTRRASARDSRRTSTARSWWPPASSDSSWRGAAVPASRRDRAGRCQPTPARRYGHQT
ncbi:hypothetical protein ACQPZJ_13185 [Actinoplanes sp. CA-054009]